MFYKIIKRIFDIFASGLALIVLLPIWFIAVIGIEISDPGPVFYMANRVGKDNKVFKMFKFRSMRVDKNANETGLRPDVDRIFWFGRLMRNTKIDELPQLINVFFGQMSVIGPRPASTDQLDITRAGENAVVGRVKPGLSGPSAVYDYIYGDQFEEEQEYRKKVLPTRLKLDVWYVKNPGISIDIKMIWYTVICIISEIFHLSTKKIYDELMGYISG